MTKEEVLRFTEIKRELKAFEENAEKLCRKIMNAEDKIREKDFDDIYSSLFPWFRDYIECNISENETEVIFTYRDDDGYDNWVTFPVEILWTENLEALVEAKLKQNYEESKKEKEERERIQRENVEKQERAQLEKLKAKYEH